MSGLPPEFDFPKQGIVRIRLRRPLVANRIEASDLEILQIALSSFHLDQSLKALILEAEGATFSAGFDLRALKERAAASQLADVEAFEKFSNDLAASRLITLVALNGPAIGGASDLVLACDLRIGVPSAGLRMPAARFGLPLYVGALRRYVQAFGLSAAKHLIFTGEFVSATDLLRFGILSEIVAPEALGARTMKLAQSIAEMPPAPLQAMKHALNVLASTTPDERKIRDELYRTFDGLQIMTRIERVLTDLKSRRTVPANAKSRF